MGLKRYTVTLSGHRTSISLEDLFWQQLLIIAESQETDVSTLVSTIDKNRTGNLSSAIRIFVLNHTLKN